MHCLDSGVPVLNWLIIVVLNRLMLCEFKLLFSFLLKKICMPFYLTAERMTEELLHQNQNTPQPGIVPVHCCAFAATRRQCFWQWSFSVQHQQSFLFLLCDVSCDVLGSHTLSSPLRSYPTQLNSIQPGQDVAPSISAYERTNEED